MEWKDLIIQIIEICIIPLAGILTTYLVMFLRKKIKEIGVNTDTEIANKYFDMLTDTIEMCVIATNQTYVEALKEKDAFDAAAHEYAFEMTKNAVLSILDKEVIKYLTNAVGDFDTYLNQQIEAMVNLAK